MSSSPLTRTVTVRNPDGLHLRPAGALVAIANQFEAELWLSNNADQVDCRSILSIVTLGAADGKQLTLSAKGTDAQAAIEAIASFFESGFVMDPATEERQDEPTEMEFENEANPTPTEQT